MSWRILGVGGLGPIIPPYQHLMSISLMPSCPAVVCNRSTEAWRTYTRKFDTAITAFRGRAALLDVEESEFATGSLDHTDVIGGCVVSNERTFVSPSLNLHLASILKSIGGGC
jgi:hypothetical protein